MARIRPAGSRGKECQRHRVDGFGIRAGKVSSRFIRHCLRRARFRGLGRRAAVHRRNATGRGGFLLAAAAAFFGALGRRGCDPHACFRSLHRGNDHGLDRSLNRSFDRCLKNLGFLRQGRPEAEESPRDAFGFQLFRRLRTGRLFPPAVPVAAPAGRLGPVPAPGAPLRTISPPAAPFGSVTPTAPLGAPGPRAAHGPPRTSRPQARPPQSYGPAWSLWTRGG